MRKYLKLGIVLSLLMTMFIGNNGLVYDAKAAIETSQNPVFHGTTKIELPLNTEFDIKHPYYRIFAIDYEDGDLTNKIEVSKNNVDTSREGTYSITYRVTDSDNNTETIEVPVTVSSSYTTISYERSLYNLATSEHTDRIAFNRGNNHDSQQLGIFVKAGTTVRLEQVNSKSKMTLKLAYYNDDAQTEVKQNWNTSSSNSYDFINNGGEAGKDSVLLVYSPRGDTQEDRPIIKVTIAEGMKPLTYYHDGDSQTAFFEEWFGNDDAFAYLETERASLVVPKGDRHLLFTTARIQNGIGLEIATEENGHGHQGENGNGLHRHISFVNTNEIQDVEQGVTHQGAQELPNTMLAPELDKKLRLQWNAEEKRLSYVLSKNDGSETIEGQKEYPNIDTVVGNEGYFMVSAGKGNSSATFQVKLDSFQADGTTITDGATFFHAAIGDVARMDENGVVSLTDGSNQQQTQSGAIHSKQKIDLTKDFELTLDINTPSDPSGLVFLFHNDPRGRVALSFGGRALGAYGDSAVVDDSITFRDLDELLGFYNEMLEQYDRYAGLDPRAEDVLDRNVKSKYLVKANKNGSGAAYYSNDHTAQKGLSMIAFLRRSWLAYHEVAHGYEGNLRNNGIFLQETLNNIFGYYYEQKYLKPGEGGWLGIFDNIEHSQFQNMRDRGYDNASYSTRLYFFVNLLNSTGNPEEASAALHKQNRRDAANGVSRLSQDLMVDVWSDYTKHNYVPYMQYASINLDERLVADIYEREYPISYFLQELVGEEKASQIKEELGLKGELSLVDASMLAPYNLKGSAELTFTIDDFKAIEGKVVNIKDGSKIVRSFTIDQATIQLDDLPVGCYYVELPRSEEYNHNFDYTNIVVKADTKTSTEIVYRRLNGNGILSNTVFQFQGLGNKLYATLQLNPETNKIEINYRGTTPHSYIDQVYSAVTITDPQGTQLYSREIIGNVTIEEPRFEEIPYEIGTEVWIKHREASSRFVPYSNFDKQIITELKMNVNVGETYVVTPYGLMKKGMSVQEQEAIYNKVLKKYFDDFVQFIGEDKRTDLDSYSNERAKVYRALLVTEEGRRILAENIDMFVEPDKTPTVTITGGEEPIEIGRKNDLYPHLNIVDYNGNPVTSDEAHVTFTFPEPMEIDQEYTIPYEVRDDEGNTAQGEVRVILKDRAPVVSVTGSEEPIKIFNKEDLYQYLDIVDYKGNKVTSDEAHVTFTFPDPMEIETEYEVSYEVKDDEDYRTQGTVRVILQDKSPVVTVTSDEEVIKVFNKDDLYQYFDIVDYKGNKVTSDADHVTFTFPDPMEVGREYEVSYEVKDDEDNTTQGTMKVILQDKSPVVTITGNEEVIKVFNKDDLYQYFDIVDYKGNKVTSDANHVTFTFPDPMEVGREYEVAYEVKDDEDNTTQGTVKVILQDKSPVVTITSDEEVIKVFNKDDLYQYLSIVDYKGNEVTSNADHVTFTFPDPMEVGREYEVAYEVKDDEDNTTQGTVRVILQDKSPVVTVTSDEEVIKIAEKDDLYQYFDIVDYKGNKVTSDAAHITFTFPDPMEMGKEYTIPYEVKDDENNTTQGTVKVVLQDKSPVVTITGSEEPIKILQQDDLYQYFDVVDYKGNKVTSDAAHITFEFPNPMEVGKEYTVSYKVVDDEGNSVQGVVRVILRDKTPTVTILSTTEPIEVAQKDDLYQYFHIVDYKGNVVPSNDTYITFDFPEMVEGQEYVIPYTIKDTEGNTTQGTVKVIIKIKTPKVEIVGGNNPIVIEEYDDLYAYLEITDYKGNKVPSDKEHITFDFSQVSSKPGEESIVPYEVRDDEGNKAQGSVIVIMKDKSPKVSIIGDMDTISIYNQQDIYKYVQIEDYKGNIIPSDEQHITFDFPASMLIGKVYNVPYEVVDNEGNRGNGVLRVIMKDKSPVVTNISSTDVIEITNEQELYAYLQITDYKGNAVLSDAAHVTFQFPDVMEIGKEYEISYEVVDDEGNKSTGTLRVRKVGSNEEETPPIENEPTQPSQPSQGENQEGKEENTSSVNTGDESGVQNALLSLMGSTLVLYGVYRRYKKKAQSLN